MAERSGARLAVIGISPPEEYKRHIRLFSALEGVYPIRAVPRGLGDQNDLSAKIVFASASRTSDEDDKLPRLTYGDAAEASKGTAGSLDVRFTRSDDLDFRLRGQVMRETSVGIPNASIQVGRGAVLAVAADFPVWVCREADGVRRHWAAIPPSELGERESIRDLLRGGRFLAHLPLVQFLREVTDYDSWNRRPIYAAFLIDDPNLHWPSYGYVRFAELAAHAREHGYHLAFATVPLDSWFVHPGVARTFKEGQSELSLAVHGNNHVYCELGDRFRSRDDALALLNQALRRVAQIEARTDLGISRVMVPPHGECSDDMLEPLMATGFEALCRAPTWWSGRSSDKRAVGGWGMADMSAYGLPVLGRHRLVQEHARAEFVLAAFLDQPVVPYGHHYDLQAGCGVLEEEASWLRTLGEVRWGSLTELARSNFMTRTEGSETLRVRLFARRAVVNVPAGVREIAVDVPVEYVGWESDSLLCAGNRHPLEKSPHGLSAPPLTTTAGAVEISLVRDGGFTPEALGRPSRNPYPVVRRIMTESRDRLSPLINRARLSGRYMASSSPTTEGD